MVPSLGEGASLSQAPSPFALGSKVLTARRIAIAAVNVAIHAIRAPERSWGPDSTPQLGPEMKAFADVANLSIRTTPAEARPKSRANVARPRGGVGPRQRATTGSWLR